LAQTVAYERGQQVQPLVLVGKGQTPMIAELELVYPDSLGHAARLRT
jgi:hypothetical protein